MKKLIRRGLQAALAATLLLTVITSGQIAARDIDASVTPRTIAPTRAELDTAIALAEDYLDGLYKPVSATAAVQSETYGLPFRVHASDRWILMGGENMDVCSTSCTTSVKPVYLPKWDEAYELTFGDVLVARATVKWNDNHNATLISVTAIDVRTDAQIWLGDKFLGAVTPGSNPTPFNLTLDRKELKTLQSLRYTVRHATQEAYLYNAISGNADRSEKLAAFLTANGFIPGFDERAPLFNASTNLPDELATDKGVYRDCESIPEATSISYPYTSRACLGLNAYRILSERDPLIQATTALHITDKYGPDSTYPQSSIRRLWLQGATPRETAEHLRTQWTRTGYGIPTCTPMSCSAPTVSSIRTSVYGILETRLGYTYGDETAKAYADAAAASLLKTQIGTDGLVHMATGDAYRPVQIGAFPVSWNTPDGQFSPPGDKSLIGGLFVFARGKMAMPSEYLGIQPSNSETTFDAWAFLTAYRCAKYNRCLA